MAEKKIKLDYSGSKGWLIFWVVVFFPVALVLLLTGGSFENEGHKYFIRYEGSKNWLCFWAVVFFPIVFLLLLLNGVALIDDDNLSTGSHRLEA
jgi:hypothetical protein